MEVVDQPILCQSELKAEEPLCHSCELSYARRAQVDASFQPQPTEVHRPFA